MVGANGSPLWPHVTEKAFSLGAGTLVMGMGDLEEDFQPFRSSRIHCHLTQCIQSSSEKPSPWGKRVMAEFSRAGQDGCPIL